MTTTTTARAPTEPDGAVHPWASRVARVARETDSETGARRLDMIRLMLVDDHEMVAQSLGRVLELEADIDVIATANSVGEGIAAAATHRPDVILMDYRLPDGDGVTAAARIKTDAPDTRIVLLTGSDDPDALRRAVDAGCLGYIDKTRSIDDLVAAVRIAATGHVAISANDLTKIAVGPRTDNTRLTKREREILFLMADGLSNRAIADRLVLSVHTVRTHAQTILAKLGAHSKLEAVAIAKRRKLVG